MGPPKAEFWLFLAFFGIFWPFFAHFYPLTIYDKSLQVTVTFFDWYSGFGVDSSIQPNTHIVKESIHGENIS